MRHGFKLGRLMLLAALLAPGLTAPAAAQQEPAVPAYANSVEYPTWETRAPGDYLSYNQRASLVQRGKLVYDKYCVSCHGEAGDGAGAAASRLITQPRDFRSGIYKFRSTDSSSLPLEADLYRTIKRGLAQVSMPAFPLMPERDLLAVIEYIKSFYPDWDEEAAERTRVNVPSAPNDLDRGKRVQRGRVVYLTMQCAKCHGIDGAGTGATQTEYTDAWGNPQKAFNFTKGRLKGGDDPEDIYRTFHTGLRSIMPAYGGTTLATVNQETYQQQAEVLSADERATLEPFAAEFPETGAVIFGEWDESQRERQAVSNSWDLVAYIMSLRQPTSTAAAVLGEMQ